MIARGRGCLRRTRLRNLSDRPLSLELVLAIRPSQVNPPAQFLNAPGGVAPISDIAWKDGALTVEPRADRISVARAEEGWRVHIRQRAAREAARRSRLERQTTRFTTRSATPTAALGYPLTLAPGASTTIAVAVPLSGATKADVRARSQSWRVDRARAGPRCRALASPAQRRRDQGPRRRATRCSTRCGPRSRIC